MGFIKILEAIKKCPQKAKIRGWIKRMREHKGKIFFLLRDETSELQCVADSEKTNKELWQMCLNATIESSVELSGTLRRDERAPHGVELSIEDFKIIGLAEKFPIQKDFSTEFLLDVRHLWLRSAKMRDALKVRDTVFRAFREFMRKELNAYETQGAMFVSGMVEGGSTLFEVPYFGKKIYLTQSSQFYLEAVMYSLGNVYTIAPSFRAEKSKTTRHLTEFWHAEGEFPWIGLKELLDIEENMIKYMVRAVLEQNEIELKALGREPKTLEPSAYKKYDRMRYEEVLKIVQKRFPYLKGATDFGEKEEREITKERKVPLLVTHYPKELKPFYHRLDPEDNKHVLCCDVLAPEGYGEIIGSGERIWELKEMLERMKEEGLSPEQYGWYVDLRRYGSVPHAGFGLGLDRFTAWVTKAQHIRDVVPFPRTLNRYYP
ncbi:MAG: asparagine--tRNA ligase [Candidatus Diapherotrites archaeon]|nr:asparagine--tRNA ligase [Candidatus Diapherotrites archaeon]